MLLLQLILFCALFTLMVKIAVGGSALNGLYFYPKPVQEKVFKLGLTDRESVARKRKRFMIPFFLVMLTALVLIIGVWNGVRKRHVHVPVGGKMDGAFRLGPAGREKVK